METAIYSTTRLGGRSIQKTLCLITALKKMKGNGLRNAFRAQENSTYMPGIVKDHY